MRTMRILIAGLLVITLALAGILGWMVITGKPAHAAGCGKDGVCVKMKHRSDGGYDPDILVRCANGRYHYVIEFNWSPCRDTTHVCVIGETEIWGRVAATGRWYKFLDAEGCHDSGTWKYRYLTVQWDKVAT